MIAGAGNNDNRIFSLHLVHNYGSRARWILRRLKNELRIYTFFGISATREISKSVAAKLADERNLPTQPRGGDGLV